MLTPAARDLKQRLDALEATVRFVDTPVGGIHGVSDHRASVVLGEGGGGLDPGGDVAQLLGRSHAGFAMVARGARGA